MNVQNAGTDTKTDLHPKHTPDLRPTVISTFAGCGGSSLGYKMAGYRELLAVEIDNHALEMFNLNYPEVPTLNKDVSKLKGEHILNLCKLKKGELDVFDGSPPCFPAGTMITTNQGRTPIDLVMLGMSVLTHKNRFKKINLVHKREYKDKLLEIKLKYGRDSVSCTPEHQLYARKRISKTRDCINKKNGSKYKAYTGPQWINACDLAIGDVILEPHILYSESLQIPSIIKKQRINTEGMGGSISFNMQLLESECCIDYKLNGMAWILGFYLAEGHLRGHNPVIGVDTPCRREVIFSVNENVVQSIVDKLNNLGLKAQVQNHSQGCRRITVTSIDFWALCSVVGKYASGKFIPDAFHTMQIEWQSEFIDGYFSGDGCYLKNGVGNSIKRKATTVSLGIVHGITKMIAKVFNIVASVEIIYLAGESVIMGRPVKVKDTYLISFVLKTSGRIRPGFVDELGQWIPIKSISEIGPNEPINVYNLDVEEDQSYTANGFAVHNCQGFSTAGKREICDPRNDLVGHYIRLVGELMPKVFIMENVPGMVADIMKGVFIKYLKQMKALDYNVSCRVLNAKWLGVPQARKRLICIGVREDMGKPIFPTMRSKIITVGEALDGVEEGEIPEYGTSKSAIKIRSQVPHVKQGGNASHLNANGNGYGLFRLNPNKPCPTITKMVSTQGYYAGMLHPTKHRLLTINELKRLQSFPDSFILRGKFEDQWARIGNSVPPLMMKAIAETVKDKILLKGE